MEFMHNLLLVFFPSLNNWSYECPLPVLLLFSSLPRVLNCMQVRDSASHPSVRLIPERHQASISLYQVRDHFYIVHSYNDSLVYKLQKDINQGYKVYLSLVLNDIVKVWKVFRGSGYTFMRSTQGASMHWHGTIQQFSIFIVSLPPSQFKWAHPLFSDTFSFSTFHCVVTSGRAVLIVSDMASASYPQCSISVTIAAFMHNRIRSSWSTLSLVFYQTAVSSIHTTNNQTICRGLK